MQGKSRQGTVGAGTGSRIVQRKKLDDVKAKVSTEVYQRNQILELSDASTCMAMDSVKRHGQTMVRPHAIQAPVGASGTLI
jgi:hypothetical protein